MSDRKIPKGVLTLPMFREAAKRAGVSPLSKGYCSALAVMVGGEPVEQASRDAGLRRSATYQVIDRVTKAVATIGVCPHCGVVRTNYIAHLNEHA